jgi:hypothetical protein
MRALDVRYHPAVAALYQDEVERHAAPLIVEARGDIGPVELLAQDRDRHRTELPGRALHQEIIGSVRGATQALRRVGSKNFCAVASSRGRPRERSGAPLP